MLEKIPELQDERLRGHFMKLSSLLALGFVKEYQAIAYDSGYLKSGDLDLINEAYNILLA